MAWLSEFLLGRPGFEYSFEINPEGMTIDEQPIAVLQRNLSGDLKKSIIRSSAPTVRINSSKLSKTQRDQFASLPCIADTFLSFQTRDDWRTYTEWMRPSTTSQIIVPSNSATRLSAILVGAGNDSIINIEAVSTVPSITAGGLFGDDGFGDGGYSGPDYFEGGSYDDESRTILLGTALPSLNPVYVTYTYKGWLVNMERFAHAARGGWLDRFIYDFQLTGA